MIDPPRTIMVANGDRSLLRLFTLIFELEGDQVFTAKTGQQVLAQLEAQAPDLLVLDIDLSLQLMDGFTLCQRIRQVCQVPILLVAARWEDQQLARALAMGADDYLLIPFHVDVLLTCAEIALHRACWRAREHPLLHPSLSARKVVMEMAHPVSIGELSGRVVLSPAEARA